MTRTNNRRRPSGEAGRTAAEILGRKPPPSNGSASHGPEPKPGRGLRTTRLDTIEPQPVRWLVPGYIPLGKLVLFAGDGGHGKTTLTLHMAACLTTGRPCFGLDYPAPEPADVLIASCEDDFADTVVPRLVTVGGDRHRVRRIDGVSTPDGRQVGFSLAHYQQLAEDLEDHPEVRLVVIDPAGAYIGGAGVDDHKDSELRSLLGPLAELAARHHVTILLVKHLNKGVTAKAVHKVGGSAGYVNAVRAAFIVAPHPNDGDKKLFVPLKFNISKKPAGLVYRLDPVPLEERAAILAPFAGLSADDRDQLGTQLFRPIWEGEAGMDADAALSEGSNQEAGRIGECAEWVVSFLGEWAWPDDEVERAGEDAGYSTSMLRRAKTQLRKEGRLGSRPGSSGGRWWNWVGTYRPQDRPTAYVSGRGESAQSAQSEHRAQSGAQTGPVQPEIPY